MRIQQRVRRQDPSTVSGSVHSIGELLPQVLARHGLSDHAVSATPRHSSDHDPAGESGKKEATKANVILTV